MIPARPWGALEVCVARSKLFWTLAVSAILVASAVAFRAITGDCPLHCAMTHLQGSAPEAGQTP